MSNNITIELCKEDRQRLDEVIGFLGLLVGEKYSKQEALAVLDPVEKHPVDAVAPFTTDETFADRLREAMDNAGVKPIELAERADVPKSMVSYYLSGKSVPKADRLFKIAKLLEVSEAWLLGYEAPKTEAPEPVAEPVAEPEQVNYTKADVQALVMKLAAPGTGKKEAVKTIVNEYAKKISDIPEEKLNEVMTKLNQLVEEE